MNQIILDLLNLFISPLSGGDGTYLAYYLSSARHWHSDEIGLALAATSICLAINQIPAGLFLDKFSHYAKTIFWSLIVLATMWFIMFFQPVLYIVLSCRAIMGISCSFFNPALITLSLQMVGRKKFDSRIARNITFGHIGNVVIAVVIGLSIYLWHAGAVLYVLFAYAVLATHPAVIAESIKPNYVQSVSVYGDDTNHDASWLTNTISHFIGNDKLLKLIIIGCLFSFANASMLPLMVQIIGRQVTHDTYVYLPSALLITELMSIPVCLIAGKGAHYGRRPLLIISFIPLMVRGLCFAFTRDPTILVSLQILDSISSGIFGVLFILMVADVCGDTNKLPSTTAIFMTLMTISSAASEYVGGLVAYHFGLSFAFISLTSVAAVGFSLAIAILPETRK